MPNAAKRICNRCRTIVEGACPRCSKERAQRRDTRENASKRGYNSHWTTASHYYRMEHPLCVVCQLNQRTTASQCVDHIIPRHSVEELFWEQDNWCALCNRCHALKTQREPRQSWTPDSQRIVVCGLPGTGKSTYAQATALPCWDADIHTDMASIEDIQRQRTAWIRSHSGPMVVIVASPLTASQVACEIGGLVKHMTHVYVNRMAVNN